MRKYVVILLIFLIIFSISACSKATPSKPVQESGSAQPPVTAEMNNMHDDMNHSHDEMNQSVQATANVADECCIDLAKKFVEYSLVWNIDEMKKITDENFYSKLIDIKGEVATPPGVELNHSSKDMKSEKIDDSTIRIVFNDYDLYTNKDENRIEHTETTRELILDNKIMIVKGFNVSYNVVKTESIQ